MDKFGIEIKIKKFGPVKNTTIRLSPLTIFTGESNLGKSYVNYLVYYIFHFLTGDGLDNIVGSKFKNKHEATITIEDIQRGMNRNVEDFMRAFLRSNTIECDVEYVITIPGTDKFEIQYKNEKTEALNLGAKSILKATTTHRQMLRIVINGEESRYPSSSFVSESMWISISLNAYIHRKIFGEVYRKMLLPPARGAFAGLDYTTRNTITGTGDMYRLYLNDFDNIVGVSGKTERKYQQAINNLVSGQLSIDKDGQYLKMHDGSMIPLTAAASSIKELSPLLYALPESPWYEIAFCIEEPEAHLHPQMQIGVADLIATCLNDNNIFHFTTHSDYILQRINQLIKLDYVRKKDKAAFKQICEKYGLTKYQCIEKDKVTVYNFSMGEDGVNVEELKVTEKGIPMKTFFGVVQDITRVEDNLNYAIRKIEGGEDNDD